MSTESESGAASGLFRSSIVQFARETIQAIANRLGVTVDELIREPAPIATTAEHVKKQLDDLNAYDNAATAAHDIAERLGELQPYQQQAIHAIRAVAGVDVQEDRHEVSFEVLDEPAGESADGPIAGAEASFMRPPEGAPFAFGREDGPIAGADGVKTGGVSADVLARVERAFDAIPVTRREFEDLAAVVLEATRIQ